jgi:hypothetical protein
LYFLIAVTTANFAGCNGYRYLTTFKKQTPSLLKNKIKLSSRIRKFRSNCVQHCKVIQYMRKGSQSLIYGEMRKYLVICMWDAISHIMYDFVPDPF